MSACPNCGSRNEPQEVEKCAERIRFYNCPDCDFSTWDRSEYACVNERVRVQAEQIAALQEALKEIESFPISGYHAGAAQRIAREALALAEGCAAPADEEEK